jgi:hypothetical protein
VTAGVNDTGVKFSAGVNNAGGHLATGDVETGASHSIAIIIAKYLKEHSKWFLGNYSIRGPGEHD